MRPKKTDIALPAIRAFFKDSKKVFSFHELRALIAGDQWDLPVKFYIDDFIILLKEKRILREISLDFSPAVTCYATKDASIYDIAHNLSSGMYFSHYTALHMHQLTDQVPKTVYVSKELTPQGGSKTAGAEGREDLTQEAIDKALQKEPRITTKRAMYKKQEIVFLNAKHTKDFGVTEIDYDGAVFYRVTSLERTLVDAAMRPYYCGGISEVMNSFIAAHERVNINKIIKLLVELDYIYPYHQVLGFYLSRTGLYSGQALDRLKRFGLDRDFYLCHGFTKDQLKYDPEWKLFYPGELV